MKTATNFINESSYINKPLTTTKLYHTSNPQFRQKIAKEGLKTSAKTENWLTDTKITGKVIFAIMSNDVKDAYDSTYDDDIYEIDATKIYNKWFRDPNFLDSKDAMHVITFDDIPKHAIKLIHTGTGESF
jgi:hypothetical protein